MGGEHPADSHCEATRAFSVDSQKHLALYTALAKMEALTYDATFHYCPSI